MIAVKCWLGHVIRIPNSRIPKRTLFDQLTDCRWDSGGPKRRDNDKAKKTLKNFGLEPGDLETVMMDRAERRARCHLGANLFKAE